MSRSIPALRRLLVAAVVGAMATGLFSTPAQAVTDAPSYYKSATTTSPQSTWIPGVMETTRDVDVYRFSTTVNRYARVLLGDLAQNYRLRLLDSAGRQIGVSDRAARGNEELYLSLRAGTYYVVVDAPHGAVSATPYVVNFANLPEAVILLSRAEYGSGVDKELDFEVLNNTSRAIDGTGYHLTGPGPDNCDVNDPYGVCTGFDDMVAMYRVIPPRQRATFFTTDIAGQPSYDFHLMPGSPISFSSNLSMTVTQTVPVSGRQRSTGTLTNRSTHYACAPVITRSSYDGRGNILSQYEMTKYGELPAGRTTSWTVSAPVPPPGTARVGWTVNERGPDLPC